MHYLCVIPMSRPADRLPSPLAPLIPTRRAVTGSALQLAPAFYRLIHQLLASPHQRIILYFVSRDERDYALRVVQHCCLMVRDTMLGRHPRAAFPVPPPAVAQAVRFIQYKAAGQSGFGLKLAIRETPSENYTDMQTEITGSINDYYLWRERYTKERRDRRLGKLLKKIGMQLPT